jgi:hypothetical protein
LTLNEKDDDSSSATHMYYRGKYRTNIIYKYLFSNENTILFESKYNTLIKNKDDVVKANSLMMNNLFSVYNKRIFNKYDIKLNQRFLVSEGVDDSRKDQIQEISKLTPKTDFILLNQSIIIIDDNSTKYLEDIAGENKISNLIRNQYNKLLDMPNNIYIYQHIYNVPDVYYKHLFPNSIKNYDFEYEDNIISESKISSYYNKLIVVKVNNQYIAGFIRKIVINTNKISKKYIEFICCKNYNTNVMDNDVKLNITKNTKIIFYKLLPSMYNSNGLNVSNIDINV